MFHLIFSFFKLLFSLWEKVPDSLKKEIIELIVKAFTQVFRTPKGTINLIRGNEEKRIVGLGEVEPQVDQTRGVIPTIRVGQTAIGLRCSEYTSL